MAINMIFIYNLYDPCLLIVSNSLDDDSKPEKKFESKILNARVQPSSCPPSINKTILWNFSPFSARLAHPGAGVGLWQKVSTCDKASSAPTRTN